MYLKKEKTKDEIVDRAAKLLAELFVNQIDAKFSKKTKGRKIINNKQKND